MNPNNPGYYREDGWACGVGRVCVQPDLSMLSPASILPDRYGGGATYTYLPTYLPTSVYVCVLCHCDADNVLHLRLVQTGYTFKNIAYRTTRAATDSYLQHR